VSRPDDESAVQGCPEERDVSVPPEGAFLTDDIEPIGEVVVRQDGVLRDHWHPISPTIQPLPHSMPMSDNTLTHTKIRIVKKES
jgi:hypothetical protein